MTKLSKLRNWFATHPAALAAIANIIVVVGTEFGLHLNAKDTAGFLALMSSVLFTWVHGRSKRAAAPPPGQKPPSA